MAVCQVCSQDMQTADACLGGVDISVVEGSRRCHDCHAAPGGTHHPGCDTERCSACGGQRLTCRCSDAAHDPTQSRWTGLWPGTMEARALNLWCRCLWPDGTPVPVEDFGKFAMSTLSGRRFHVPCERGDAGAREDLNRLAEHKAAALRRA